MTTTNFKTLHVWDTIHSADSVEWCPFSPYKNSLACGTYQLVDGNKEIQEGEVKEYQRTGAITILTLFKNKLEENYSIKCPAVLDLKWCPRKLNDNIFLAAANAAGEVCLYCFGEKILKFVAKYTLKKEPGDFLTLSLDWGKKDAGSLICASDSKGNIAVLEFSKDRLNLLKEWNAHSLEAWIVCFDSFNSNIIYSGGDEAQLKIWDCRNEEPYKIASNNKHTAGVTTLTSNLYNEYNLISGSYDELVFFWDTRNWKRPMETITASGGLWRLKWEPRSRSSFLLAACVYGGFQIYNTSSHSVVAEYKEHESLAYGADWCYLSNDEVDSLLGCSPATLIATCSFYDHKLCISLWDEN